MFDSMHFIYYINRSIATKIDSLQVLENYLLLYIGTIGQVNKMYANFGCLQMSVFVCLFKLTVADFMDLKCCNVVSRTNQG